MNTVVLQQPTPFADAVLAYRYYLQEVLTDMLDATAALPPGIVRLQIGIISFFESCLGRRDRYLWLLQSDHPAAVGRALSRLSQPFNFLLLLELQKSGCDDAAAQVQRLVRDIGRISRVELRKGGREREQRALLLRQIGAELH